MIFHNTENEGALLKALHTGMWEIEIEDGKRPRMYFDDIMRQLSGIPKGMNPEVAFEFFNSNVHQNDRKPLQEYFDTLAAGKHTEIVYRYIHPSLGEMYIRCEGVGTTEPDGITYVHGLHRNITDIVHIQKKQDIQTRTLAQLTQLLYSYNITLNPENSKYTLIKGTGLERTVDIFRSGNDFMTAVNEIKKNIHPDFRKIYSDFLNPEQLRKPKDHYGFIGKIEFPILYPGDTRYEWHEVNVFSENTEDGEYRINILGRDITQAHEQQEQRERELKYTATRNQVLSDLTKMLYNYNIMLNLSTGKYSLIEGTGMTRAMEVFKSTDDYETAFAQKIRYVEPEYVEAFRNIASIDALKSRKNANGFIGMLEYSAETEHGKEWNEINVFISLDEKGDSIANILGRDMTEAHERADTLAQLKIATAASEAKTAFLFNMSHDIRTPMNAIMGFTELLEKYQDREDKRRDYLHKIRESSAILLSIINNVLEMARIENGQPTLNESAWSAEQFNDTLYSVFHDMMNTKDIEFTREINVTNHYVFCDPIKLREVFINILSNAYKYTPSGGKVQMLLNEIPSDRDGYAMYQTTITDTGIGMSEDYIPHIFEEFTREHTSTENKVEGTGLGMPIVKKLLDIMGGAIEVKSKLGKGSTFIVTIPHRIAERSDLANLEHTEIHPDTFKGKRILLAEDNDLNAEIAEEILTEVGFKVERAEDGSICVDMLKNSQNGYYDLILMDIQMPNMNGYQATKSIRALDDVEKSSIPIFAITANAFEEDRREAVRSGMNGHIAKPIVVADLMDNLSSIFD